MGRIPCIPRVFSSAQQPCRAGSSSASFRQLGKEVRRRWFAQSHRKSQRKNLNPEADVSFHYRVHKLLIIGVLGMDFQWMGLWVGSWARGKGHQRCLGPHHSWTPLPLSRKSPPSRQGKPPDTPIVHASILWMNLHGTFSFIKCSSRFGDLKEGWSPLRIVHQ